MGGEEAQGTWREGGVCSAGQLPGASMGRQERRPGASEWEWRLLWSVCAPLSTFICWNPISHVNVKK